MRPPTDAERAQVRELAEQGKGRNEIARLTGINARRVSMIAGDIGVSFARTGAQTRAATEARAAQAADRRAAIEQACLASAEKLLSQMWKEATVFNFGGKDNDYNERSLPEPPFADKRAIASSVQALMATALKLSEHDRKDTHGSDLDAYLEHMAPDDEEQE